MRKKLLQQKKQSNN